MRDIIPILRLAIKNLYYKDLFFHRSHESSCDVTMHFNFVVNRVLKNNI